MEILRMVKIDICRNCKYYRQHYIKSRSGVYEPLLFGHCAQGIKVHPGRTCPYWPFGRPAWTGDGG